MTSRKVLGAALVAVNLFFVASCTSSGKGKAVDASDSLAVEQVDLSDAYQVDSTSVLYWKGFKIGGSHDGTLRLSDGKFSIRDGKLLGGYVEVDMNSLAVTDLEGDMAEKLRGHLLSADFFETETYPTAKFELTSTNLDLNSLPKWQGNLTLKGKTKNIEMQGYELDYNTETDTYTIKMQPFRINRADWDVRYGSKTFFSDLADKAIDDEVEIAFTLVLKR